MSQTPFPVPPSAHSSWGAPGGSDTETGDIGDTQSRSTQQQPDNTDQRRAAEETERTQQQEQIEKKEEGKRGKEKKGQTVGNEQNRRRLRSSGQIEEISLGYLNRREVAVKRKREEETPHTSRPDEEEELAEVRPIPQGATPYPGESAVACPPIHDETDSPTSGPPKHRTNREQEEVENGQQREVHGTPVGVADSSLEVGRETETEEIETDYIQTKNTEVVREIVVQDIDEEKGRENKEGVLREIDENKEGEIEEIKEVEYQEAVITIQTEEIITIEGIETIQQTIYNEAGEEIKIVIIEEGEQEGEEQKERTTEEETGIETPRKV